MQTWKLTVGSESGLSRYCNRTPNTSLIFSFAPGTHKRHIIININIILIPQKFQYVCSLVLHYSVILYILPIKQILITHLVSETFCNVLMYLMFYIKITLFGCWYNLSV